MPRVVVGFFTSPPDPCTSRAELLSRVVASRYRASAWHRMAKASASQTVRTLRATSPGASRSQIARAESDSQSGGSTSASGGTGSRVLIRSGRSPCSTRSDVGLGAGPRLPTDHPRLVAVGELIGGLEPVQAGDALALAAANVIRIKVCRCP